MPLLSVPLSSVARRAGPFWSVLVPTYEPDAALLAEALAGPLASGLPEADLEITVVDDASATVDVESLVTRIAGGRVGFVRQPRNVGLIGNWNDCLRRARGDWVHLLHQDDVVDPSYHRTLQAALAQAPHVGAAFCRHVHLRGGQPVWLSALERAEAGVLTEFLPRLARGQRIQFAAMVVRRAVYQALGGFDPRAGSAADWEMWVRVAARHDVWFEPQALAGYRLHVGSESSRLSRTAQNVADVGRAIDLIAGHLPAAGRADLIAAARVEQASSALEMARVFVGAGHLPTALAHVREALRLDGGPATVSRVLDVLDDANLPDSAPTGAGPVPAASATTPAQPLPEPERPASQRSWQPEASEPAAASPVDDLQELAANVDLLQANPTDDRLSWSVRRGRLRLVRALLSSADEPGRLERDWTTRLRALHAAAGRADLVADETPDERALADRLRAIIGTISASRPPTDVLWAALLAYALFRPIHAGALPFDLAARLAEVPGWLLDDALAYLLAFPSGFDDEGEAERYALTLEANLAPIVTGLRAPQPSAAHRAAALHVVRNGNFIPTYFTPAPTRDLQRLRGDVLRELLAANGAQLDCPFSVRGPDRTRLRVGFLNAHFAPQTETYSTLPTFEALDRTRFDVRLFAVQLSGPNEHPLERHARAHADAMVALPPGLPDQVAALRGADLDLLVIGTNVTAVTNQVALLAAHRLARVQLVTNSCPVTSGLASVDGYVSGDLSETEGADAHYCERLWRLDGAAHAFNYRIDATPAQTAFDRARLGIPRDAVVFASGANFHKITPELQRVWVQLMLQVEGAVLLLHPFNPNWSDRYPVARFERRLRARIAAAGLPAHSLCLSRDALPGRADVKALLSVADVYLDSFPFAGVNSTVDPLELGLPVVAWEGETFRSRMAGALLRELKLDHLIAHNEASYLSLATALGRDAQLRAATATQIRAAMAAGPRFLDPVAYGRSFGALLERIWAFHQQR